MIARPVDYNQVQLVFYPNPLLRQVAQPVDTINEEIVQLSERMIDVMIESSGVGLAAPQVGVSLRIITVSPTGKRQDSQVLINPVLSELSGISEMEEGCLSIPDVRAKVRRAAACTVDALDLDGNKLHVDAVDFFATIVQHETDHLDGKLFIDKISTLSKMAVKRKLKMLEYDFNK